MAASLLDVRGVCKHFGGLKVLTGVDLSIAPGQVKCIIGPNGCGKSTLFNILTGVLRADGGEFHVDGVPAHRLPPQGIARLGVLRKFQVPGVLAGLSVIENLEVASLGRRGGGVAASLRAGADQQAASQARGVPAGRAAALREFGLFAHRFELVEQLPHGLKQQLELLMLLSRGPRLLLLDEPTAGMTAQETAATAALIRRVSSEHGIAVLVIEHDMHFVRDLDCPLIVMLKGVVQREGDYDAIRVDPQVRAAYLGERA